MEFKLNDYHRDIPDNELIEDLQSVSKELEGKSLTIEEYKKRGKYSYTTISIKSGIIIIQTG